VARMIPPILPEDAAPGEQLVFQRLASDPATEGWTVLHSLDLARHVRQVEGEADFVVVAPTLGVLAIEVKSHQSVRRLDSGEWVLGRNRPTVRSPFRQAAEERHSIRRFLGQTRIDLTHVPVWSSVWFSRTRARPALPPSPEWHDWQVLDLEDLTRGAGSAVRRVLVSARRHLADHVSRFDEHAGEPSEATCRAIVKALRPRFELVAAPGDARRHRERQLAHFLDEQMDALDQMEAAARVLFTGPAGSGKTFLALEAARRAARRQQRVQLACFNRMLGAYLCQATRDQPGIEAGTLHSSLLKVSGLAVPEHPPTSWWSGDLVEAAIERLLDSAPLCDALIVDEAQDLCTAGYLDALDLIVEGGLAGGRCLLFGDFERQSLYGLDDGRQPLRDRIPDLVPFMLTTNCRNTPRIGEAASFICDLRPGFRRYRRPDDGVGPEYIWYRNRADQPEVLGTVLRQLLDEHFDLDEIAVLSPRADSAAASATEPWLRGHLAEASVLPQPGKARYSTIHAFKGLDAPAVVLTDIDEPWGTSFEAVLYVGLTRATDRLIVLARRESLRERLLAARRHHGD
jgi:Nuclease-related domain/UvrD-like helicase C-terminal domain/AAA domain